MAAAWDRDLRGDGVAEPVIRRRLDRSDALLGTAPVLLVPFLSMANAGPGTDGSQFFLTFVPTGYLDGKHTVFGETVKGMDTLKALEGAGSASGKTKEKLEIKKATIRVE